MTGRRSGRRPGSPDTRAAIVDAAREAFAENGFTRATVRSIAERAGVDPALVHHYFGTKKDLFLAATALPVDPSLIIEGLLSGGTDGLGHRLVGALVGIWDSPAGTPLLAALRGVAADDAQTDALRQFLVSTVLSKVLTTLEVPRPEAQLRASLAASQVIGLITARYLLRLPPLADLPAAAVVAAIGPTIQHYLTGELSDGRPPPPAL